MKRSSLLGHMVELVGLVRAQKAPADQVIQQYFRARHYLGSRDRRLIADHVWGILRNWVLLETYCHQAGCRSGEPGGPGGPPDALMLLAAYLLKLGSDTPATLLPELSGIWTASFRALDCRQALEAIAAAVVPDRLLSDPVSRLHVMYSAPEPLVSEWLERLGLLEAEQLCRVLNEEAPITIRVNALKCGREECIAALAGEGVEARPTELSPSALVLSRRMNAGSLMTFRRGWFEMQDEGSQMLSFLTGAQQGMLVVDACAGGGGKTLHLAALMDNKGTLLAVDVDEHRLRNIPERLARAGVAIARLLHADRDRPFLAEFAGKADAVLVDAPCSGVGIFRRNPGAKMAFSEGTPDRFRAVQSAILRRNAELVKPGGRLVYTTCTLVKRENEEVVENFLKDSKNFTLVPVAGILSARGIPVDPSSPYLHLWPHRAGTDGFFGAVMVRAA